MVTGRGSLVVVGVGRADDADVGAFRRGVQLAAGPAPVVDEAVTRVAGREGTAAGTLLRRGAGEVRGGARLDAVARQAVVQARVNHCDDHNDNHRGGGK